MVQRCHNFWHEPFDDNQIAEIVISVDILHLPKWQRHSHTHLMDTPKHFAAMAASKKTAALGKVSCETAWNEACLPCVFAAHKESR